MGEHANEQSDIMNFSASVMSCANITLTLHIFMTLFAVGKIITVGTKPYTKASSGEGIIIHCACAYVPHAPIPGCMSLWNVTCNIVEVFASVFPSGTSAETEKHETKKPQRKARPAAQQSSDTSRTDPCSKLSSVIL